MADSARRPYTAPLMTPSSTPDAHWDAGDLGCGFAPFAAGGLRFACQPDCGACCSRPGKVRLDRAEARAMAAALGLGQAEFRRRWVLNAGGALRLVDGLDGACPFLGEDRRCRVYAARPAQCRRYPFWPELLADASTWEWEALRCPGIGQGPLIPAD